MSDQTRKPGRLMQFRDILSWCGGWFLIIYQTAIVNREDFNIYPLLLGGALIGAPGVAEVLRFRLTGISGRAGSSQEPDSPQPESSSSSTR